MLRVESKLAEWRGVYDRHLDAQRRLSAAEGEGRKESELEPLRAEVRQLQLRSDDELQAIQQLMKKVKQPRSPS